MTHMHFYLTARKAQVMIGLWATSAVEANLILIWISLHDPESQTLLEMIVDGLRSRLLPERIPPVAVVASLSLPEYSEDQRPYDGEIANRRLSMQEIARNASFHYVELPPSQQSVDLLLQILRITDDNLESNHAVGVYRLAEQDQVQLQSPAIVRSLSSLTTMVHFGYSKPTFGRADAQLLCDLLPKNLLLEEISIQCERILPDASKVLIGGLLANPHCKRVSFPVDTFKKSQTQPWAAVYNRLTPECKSLIFAPSAKQMKPCVKVLLLGHGAAGKTSILRALQQLLNRALPPSSLTEQSTVGVETHALEDSQIDFSVWDFAGQLEYLSTHHYFFSRSNAVYVVVVDVSRPLETQRSHIGNWLGILCGKLGNYDASAVRVIIVGTKVDLLRERFDAEISSGPILAAAQEWNLPYNSLPKKRLHFVSAITQVGIKELRSLLVETAQDLVRRQSLVSNEDLAQAVMRVGQEIHFAQENDISRIMQPASVFAAPILTALHDRGVLLWQQHSYTVCLWPSLLSRIIALFVSPAEHRQRLGGTNLAVRDPLVVDSDAVAALRLLPELQPHATNTLLALLLGLEALGICYRISPEEAMAYGRSGFLFPSLRPACELFYLPQSLPVQPKVPLQLYCKALQFRIPPNVASGPELFTRLQVKARSLHDARYRIFSNCMILRSADRLAQALVMLVARQAQWLLRVLLRGASPDSLFRLVMELFPDLQHIPMDTMCGVCAQSARFLEAADDGRCSDGHMSDLRIGAPVDPVLLARNSLWSPKEGDRFLRAGAWQQRSDILRHTTLREGDAEETRRLEFNRIRQMFYKFVGQDREQNFALDRVVFLQNVKCEGEFATFYEHLMSANLAKRPLHENEKFDAADSSEDHQWRCWVLKHLDSYVERVSGNERINLIASWHGTSEETCWRIAENNFLEPAELEAKLKELGKEQTDPGYFGKGIYFTQFPSYGASYTKSSMCLLLSWVLMGRAYPVIEEPLLAKNVRTLLGRDCVPSFDSHYVVVKQKGPTFLPCRRVNDKGLPEQPDYDEVVVFRKQQILPRCIVYFRRVQLNVPAPVAAAANQRFRQEDDATHAHAPLTIMWVDSSFSGGGQDTMVNMLQKSLPASQRQVCSLICTDELKMWLRTHRACMSKKKLEVRVITNRTRERDGGESAGEQLISWLRSTSECADWNKIKCLLFCSQTAKVQHVSNRKTTFVTSDSAILVRYCDPKVDWKSL